MFIDGIKLGEGSDITNLTIASGTSYPAQPSIGELYFRTDVPQGLYVYDGSTWIKAILDGTSEPFLNLSDKKSVKFATTADTVLSGLQTVDGHTVSDGDRILVKDQTIPSENGIYIASTNAWTRASDLTGAPGESCSVENGFDNSFSRWMVANSTQITFGIDDVTFKKVGGVVGAGSGINITPFGITAPGEEEISVLVEPTGAIEINGNGNLDNVDLTVSAGLVIGTYTSVDVDAYGRVTFGTNPTTLAGYGITDAQPLDDFLTALSSEAIALNTGIVTMSGGILVLDTNGYQPLATVLTDITAAETAVANGVITLADGVMALDTELTGFSAAAILGDGIPIRTGGVWAMDPGVPLTSATTFTVTDLVGSNLSGTGTYDALEINLSQTGVTAGTYKSVTVDVYGRVTAGTNPTTLADYGITNAYTKTEIDTLLAGLDVRASVRAATTTNITLSAPQTIDGVSVIAGNRVLVKNQTIASENGIYTVAAGAWTRAADANTAAELSSGTYCFVEEGTVNADSGWILITDGTITLGTTSLTFTQFNGLGQVIAGTGLTKAGNTISLSSGVTTPGTYKSVTVDTYGRVTVGTNPTTLAGYGITDAPVINPGSPKDGDIKIDAGPIISIYASSAWRQIWPAVYS